MITLFILKLEIVILLSMTHCKSIGYERFITKYYQSNTFTQVKSKTQYLPEPSMSALDEAPFIVTKYNSLATINDAYILGIETYYYNYLAVLTHSNTSYRISYYFNTYNTLWTNVKLSFLAFDNNYVGFTLYYQQYYTTSSPIYGNMTGIVLQSNDKVVHFIYSFCLSGWTSPATIKSIMYSHNAKLEYDVKSQGIGYITYRPHFSSSDALKQYFKVVVFSHGFNHVISTTQQNLPGRIFITGYSSSTIVNLNLMMILLMIAPILSISFYVIHKKSVKYRIKMQKYSKLALGQGMLTAILFIQCNFSCSLVTILFSDINQSYFYLSIIQLLIISGIFALTLWLFLTKDKMDWIIQILFELEQFF